MNTYTIREIDEITDQHDQLLVSLCSEENKHALIPGSIHLEPSSIIRTAPPIGGLLPDEATFSKVLQRIGYTPEKQLVIYDDEGGGWAGRFIYTLDAFGIHNHSFLNGGLLAWLDAGKPTAAPITPQPSNYMARYDGNNTVDANTLMPRLNQDDLALLDARSPEEYAGTTLYSARGGHIPGAVNLNWTDCMDHQRSKRLLPLTQLRQTLEAKGITPDKEVVVYCQTHHRSSLSYVMLKALGYERIKGYHGAWSEWGNREDTPIEL